MDFPGSSDGKNLSAVEKTSVGCLGWEDPLEREWQLTPGFLPREFHVLTMGLKSWKRLNE